MDLAPVHQALITQLESRINSAGGDFYDGNVPDGKDPRRIAGTDELVPYAVLWMGDDYEAPNGRALNGAIDALGILIFGVVCVASTNFKVTQMRDVVTRALIGWKPTYDSGEVAGDGGGAYQPVPALLKPTHFVRELGFSVLVGAAGAPVQL